MLGRIASSSTAVYRRFPRLACTCDEWRGNWTSTRSTRPTAVNLLIPHCLHLILDKLQPTHRDDTQGTRQPRCDGPYARAWPIDGKPRTFGLAPIRMPQCLCPPTRCVA